MELTTASPAEIDTVLAEIWGRIAALQIRISDTERAVRQARSMARYGGLSRIPALEATIKKLAEQLQQESVTATAIVLFGSLATEEP